MVILDDKVALKYLSSLTSNKTPYIKKRQIMRAAFGDYRQKMREEELKFNIGK